MAVASPEAEAGIGYSSAVKAVVGGPPALLVRPLPTWRFVAGLSLFAVITYLAFLILLPSRWAQNESTDYFSSYEPVAQNLLAGKGFVNPDGTMASRYPPGFSLILAGLFKGARLVALHDSVAIRALITVVVAVLPILIYGIAATAFKRSVAILAGALFASYPFFLWLTKQPNSEIPFFIVFFLAVYFFLRSISDSHSNVWFGFVVGGLVGAASLIRPIAVLLSFALLLALWLSARRWTITRRIIFSALLLLGNFLVVLPWEVTVREKTGKWILLCTNGPQSILDGLTFAVDETKGSEPVVVTSAVSGFMQEVKARSEEMVTVGALGRFLAKKLANEPSMATSLILLKMKRVWYANDSRSLERWIAFLQAPYLLFAVLGGIIAARAGQAARQVTIVVALIVCYFWAMTAIALPILRYMVPAMGLLMPFASLGVISLGKRLRSLRHHQAAQV